MAQGPFVICAAICEHVIEGKDNVLSAIRLIDQITLANIAPGQPRPTDPRGIPGRPSANVVDFTFLVALKAGDFRGSGKVRVEIKTPAGSRLAAKEIEAHFPTETKGQNLILRGDLVPEAGIYWFEVYFDDRLLTRSPLDVRLVSGSTTTTTGRPEASQTDKP